MCYELDGYNNEEHLREHIEWCQKFLELSGNMVDIVYMDEVGFNLHFIRQFGRARPGQRCHPICPTQRDRKLSLVVAIGREGVIAHDATLGAYNTDKFFKYMQAKVIPSLDRQRFILTGNVVFHIFRKIQQAFEDVGHIYFHLPSYSPFLNVAEWIFGHIKSQVQRNNLQNHQTLLLHIGDDIQAIATNMVQGWI